MRRPEGTLTLPQKRKADPADTGSAIDCSFLVTGAVGFNNWDVADAQRWGNALLARRVRWMDEHSRRLPRAHELDRQRYGATLMGGRHRG